MRGIQDILQKRPHTAIVLHGSRLWDVVFYVPLDPQVKAQHVIDYLIAQHTGDLTDDHLCLWLLLLRTESSVDFFAAAMACAVP